MTTGERSRDMVAILHPFFRVPLDPGEREYVVELVERLLGAAVAAERDRCARIAVESAEHHRDHCPPGCHCADGWHIAMRIRKRP